MTGRRLCVGALVGLLAFTSCVGFTAHAAEKTLFQNFWVWQPNTSPFWLAIDKGYYRAEGLDVTYIEGKGSAYAIQRVAAEKADVGVSDLGTAAFGISREVPIRGIFCFLQTGPQGVVARKEAGVRTLKDLEGKRLGFSPGDSGWILFPALASANGVDISRITKVSAEPAALPKALLARNVDAILTYFTSVPEFSDRGDGVQLTYLRYADHKVNLLGAGLIAHESTIRNRSDMLRKFIRASQRGYAHTLRKPEDAIDNLIRRAPLTVAKREIALQNLKLSLGLLHTTNSMGEPIGWMAREDWEQTVALLAKYRDMKPLPVDRYYTNGFTSPDIRGGGT